MINIIRGNIYTSLRTALLERIRDKESTIRVQATISLAKLSGIEDPVAEEPAVIDVLLETLTYDPTAYVSYVIFRALVITRALGRPAASPFSTSCSTPPHLCLFLLIHMILTLRFTD